MKYKVKKIGDFESSIEITIDFDDLEEKKDDAISKIGKSLKVKGFRPGKIPKNIVVREVGEDYVLEEAIDLYLPEQIFDILNKEEISPAVRPVIKDLKKEKKSFKIEVLITLWPKLSKLPKLEQTIEVESIEPTEDEINEEIHVGWLGLCVLRVHSLTRSRELTYKRIEHLICVCLATFV